MYEYIDYTNPASPVNKYLSWYYTYSTGKYTIKTRPSSSTGTDADCYYGMKWSFNAGDDVGCNHPFHHKIFISYSLFRCVLILLRLIACIN